MAYDGLRVSVGMRLKTQYDGLLLAALLLGPALLAASRDLDWFDGPELALAAVIGGVAHPPGEPLHTLLPIRRNLERLAADMMVDLTLEDAPPRD